MSFYVIFQFQLVQLVLRNTFVFQSASFLAFTVLLAYQLGVAKHSNDRINNTTIVGKMVVFTLGGLALCGEDFRSTGRYVDHMEDSGVVKGKGRPGKTIGQTMMNQR